MYVQLNLTRYALTVLVTCTVPFAVSLSCAQQRSAPSSQQAAPGGDNYLSFLSSLRIPTKLELFGESVPVAHRDVKERIEREFYWTLQQPGQLILNLKRSARYFSLFEAIFKEEGVPEDCKYVAVAESALFMARSPKDAVGIWQFMEGTAKSYGLEVTEYVDERRHVEKSTRAAARFLKDAYQKFGSWSLAAAAYNMGMEGVRSAIEIQGSSQYYDLYLNEETSRYLPRIAVIKEIMEHASTYGVRLEKDDVYAPEAAQSVKVYSAIDNLAQWATEKGSTYKDVKLLNPWILKNNLPKPKNGFWEILLKK